MLETTSAIEVSITYNFVWVKWQKSRHFCVTFSDISLLVTVTVTIVQVVIVIVFVVSHSPHLYRIVCMCVCFDGTKIGIYEEEKMMNKAGKIMLLLFLVFSFFLHSISQTSMKTTDKTTRFLSESHDYRCYRSKHEYFTIRCILCCCESSPEIMRDIYLQAKAKRLTTPADF